MLNSNQMSMKFVLVIDFKMPTITGILNLLPQQMTLSSVLSNKLALYIFYLTL